MSDLKIGEAGSVQFPMVRHAEEIGWTSLKPQDAIAKRGGETGLFLRDELSAKLLEFNPWLSTDASRSVIERLEAVPATIEGNRVFILCNRKALDLPKLRIFKFFR